MDTKFCIQRSIKKNFWFEFVIAKVFWYGHILNMVTKSMPRLWCDRLKAITLNSCENLAGRNNY